MPAARITALERGPAHEGGEVAHAPAHLSRRGAEQHRMIGSLQRRPRREGAFDLARSPLVLDRSQRQGDLPERLGERGEHRLHQIHVGFGVIGKARLRRRGLERPPAQARNAGVLVGQMIFRDPQQVPFDLQADDAPHALVGQPLELSAQQLAGRKVKGHAAGEVFVAQHPADARRPRQHAERRRVRNDREIGRAGHLVEAHAAAARERREDAGIGGIERGGRHVDVVAGLERGEESLDRHRLGARGAVRIGPGQPYEVELFFLDSALELLGLPSLLIRPEAVSFDETEGLCHLHHSMRETASRRNVDDTTRGRKTRKIFTRWPGLRPHPEERA